MLPIGILISVVLLADSSPSDHRAWEEGWGGTERKQTQEGGEGDDCSGGENRGTEEPPLLAEGWAWQIGWLITVLMLLCQQGHLVVPPPLLAPVASPENPDRDDYRCGKEMRITLLVVERKKWWKLMKSGQKMAEAAQLAWFGLSWPVGLFNPSIH